MQKNNCDLCSLQETDIAEIVTAFKAIGWNKPRIQYEAYLQEQHQHLRSVIVARIANVFSGYVTIKWQSEYAGFNLNHIPEIADLNVLPHFRKQGIGTKLLLACEALAKERKCSKIGLGVGLTADYGSAQRLYVRLGYIPDGKGIHYKNKVLNYSDTALVDDDLVLYFNKSLLAN